MPTTETDLLAMPVPLVAILHGDSKQNSAACAVAQMLFGCVTDCEDGRYLVLLNNGWRVRVCHMERGYPLRVGDNAESDYECFALVWATGDDMIFDVRGFVSWGRLQREGAKDGNMIEMPETSLSPPMAMGQPFKTWPMDPNSVKLT